MTCALSVNNKGNLLFVPMMIAAKTIPSIPDVKTLTMIENFAAFGFPAPSSFDTLTLQNQPHQEVSFVGMTDIILLLNLQS